jgi:hypothetical protein
MSKFITRPHPTLVHGAKQFLWDVTHNGRTVQKWATSVHGARSQAMTDFGVRDVAGITARKVRQ